MSGTAQLDEGQYAPGEIAKYEAIYGRNFVSPGGRAAALEFTRMLSLRRGELVLDCGCGLGGGAFLMARQYGARVHAIDLSRNMVEIARHRLREAKLENLVTIEHGDCLDLAEAKRYDAVYSRDVFLHVADKPRLFDRLYSALRPGGRVLITDYCCAPRPWSAEFSCYVERRGYDLRTVPEYGRLLSLAGLEPVHVEDRTPQFIDIHERELRAFDARALGEHETEDLKRGWQAKLERARRGEQRWGLFIARKPG